MKKISKHSLPFSQLKGTFTKKNHKYRQILRNIKIL